VIGDGPVYDKAAERVAAPVKAAKAAESARDT
jgi:hypothetical protein